MSRVERRFKWLLLLGLIVLVAVVIRVDWQEVVSLVAKAGGWLVVALVLHSTSRACAALAWRELVAERAEPPGWRRSVAIYWVGQAFNALAPGEVLGELAKGTLAARSIDGVVTAASLIDHRVLVAASGIAAGVIGSSYYLVHPELPGRAALVLLGANLFAGLILIAVWRAVRAGAAPRIVSWLVRIPVLSDRTRERLCAGGERLDRELSTAEKARGSRRLQVVAWLVAMRVLQAAEMVVLLSPLLPSQSPWDLFVLGLLARSTMQLATWTAFGMPAKLGVLEGAQAVLFAGLGLIPATGVALQLLMRARSIAFVAIGLGIGWREVRGSDLAEPQKLARGETP